MFADSIAATPPFRPPQLANSYLRTAHAHHEQINHLIISLQFQFEAARIASRSLDMNILAILDTFEGIASGSRKELAKQASLLAGLEADLEIISRVSIHTEFVSPAVRKAIESGEKQRTLGDYVSNVKMKQVAKTCSNTHGAQHPIITSLLLTCLQMTFKFASMKWNKLSLDSRKEVTLFELLSLLPSNSFPFPFPSLSLTHIRSLDDTDRILHRARDIFDRVADAANSLESCTIFPTSLSLTDNMDRSKSRFGCNSPRWGSFDMNTVQ